MKTLRTLKKTKLSLSEEEFSKFLIDNRRLINLHAIASHHYISFRCLYLNKMLNQAYVLAEQAIETYFVSYKSRREYQKVQ